MVKITTKSYLQQITRLEKMIQNKLSEIYRLKTMACSVTILSEKDKVQTSFDKDRLGSTVAKIVDLEGDTDKLVNEFTDKRNHIIQQIDSMSNTDYYNILSLRYVNGNTFEEISKLTTWSIRQVFKLHGKALLEFERLYGKEYLENVQ